MQWTTKKLNFGPSSFKPYQTALEALDLVCNHMLTCHCMNEKRKAKNKIITMAHVNIQGKGSTPHIYWLKQQYFD